MTSRILAHLARRFTVSEENLATEALTYLLSASHVARGAMNRLVRDLGCDLPADLVYVGQVGADGAGRPDIVGTDSAGQERLVLEAKFAAGLTEQQPGGYLTRLPVDAEGVVLVVAPNTRLASLWRELLTELGVPGPPDVRGPRRHAVSPHSTLALVSWRDVVSSIRDALTAAGETTLVEDATQLLALTEVMDSTAYLPPRPGDLGERTGQLVYQVQHLIERVRQEIDPAVGAAISKSSAMDYAGWYMKSSRTGRQCWFGFLPRTWARFGVSPLWAQSNSRMTGLNRQQLQQALGTLSEPGYAGLFEEQGFLTPLIITPNAGEDEAVAALRVQLQEFITRLDSASAFTAPAAEPLEASPV